MTAIQVFPRRPATAAMSRRQAAALLIAAAAAVGLALRVAEARGDLWLDEIWSLTLVGAVPSPAAVFWGISHDNNHFLNSFWLALAGPDRAPWIYRAPAVVLGTLSIPLAGRIGLARGRAAGVAAAWLAALAPPLVVYGSEARGYAGLVFATLLAIEAFGRALDAPEGRGSGWGNPAARRLGLAVGMGTLFHLTMLAALGTLGLAALLRLRLAGRSWRGALDGTLDLLGPSLVALVPAMAAVSAGIVVRGGFTFGDVVPFTGDTFVGGYGGLLGLILGLPGGVPRWAALVTAALVLLAALRLGRDDPTRRCLAAVALVALPAAMVLARLPNLEFPRYFLVPGLVLVVALADVVGRLWAGGPVRRGAALVLLAATLAGQAAADRTVIGTGRGRYADAVALMAAEGRPTYTADNRFMVETVAAFTAARAGLTARFVRTEALCGDPPDWFVDVLDDGPGGPPPAVMAGPPTCRMRFTRRAVFPAAALSGMGWTLYRRG